MSSHPLEIKSQESMFKAMIANISDVIVIIDHLESIRFASPNLERRFGWTPDEILNTNCFERIYDLDRQRIREEMVKLREVDNGIKTMEYRYVCKDQSIKFIELTAVNLIKDPDVQGILCNFSDVTNKKINELEIAKAKDFAEKANRDKDQFLANISHEIRTPLNAIMGTNQLMESSHLDPEQKELLEISKGASHMLLKVINEILDYSCTNSDYDDEDADVIMFSLNDVLEEIEREFYDMAIAKELTFYMTMDGHIPEYLIGSKKKLTQVLYNLLDNAFKFTKVGTIHCQTRMIDEEEKNINIEFRIIDTGIGIDVKDQKRIFHRFVQVDGSYTREVGGIGLGLYLSKKHVTEMNGELWVESTVGKGSEFCFTSIFERMDLIKFNIIQS